MCVCDFYFIEYLPSARHYAKSLMLINLIKFLHQPSEAVEALEDCLLETGL